MAEDGPQLSDRRRLAQIVRLFASRGMGGLAASLGLGAADRGGVGRPEALVDLLRELGPVAVKFGQILAMRSDLLAPEWTSALATLQDRAPGLSFDIIRPTVEGAVGGPVEEYFSSIDPVPIAAGSIAQVHTAVRRDGAALVIKVRRPGIEAVVDADLRLLRRLARLAERANSAIARQRPEELLRFFAESLDQEMDLSAEARASFEIGEFLRPLGVETAGFDWEVSGRSLNVQEWIDALPASDLESIRSAGIDLNAVARTYAEAVLKMIIFNGRFHADPHPGNVMVRRDGTLVFIDFGAVGTLLPHRRDELVRLSLAIAAEDTADLADVLLGWAGNPSVDREGLRGALSTLLARFKNSVLEQIQLAEVFADVFALLRSHKLAMPPDLALMLRTLLTAEGFVRRIDPRFDIAAELAPIARQLIIERTSPRQLHGQARRAGAALGRMAFNAPELIGTLERIARSGRLPITLDPADLTSLAERLRASRARIDDTVPAGLIVAAAILAEGHPITAAACAASAAALLAVDRMRRR